MKHLHNINDLNSMNPTLQRRQRLRDVDIAVLMLDLLLQIANGRFYCSTKQPFDRYGHLLPQNQPIQLDGSVGSGQQKRNELMNR